MVHEQSKNIPYFDATAEALGSPAAVWMGVAGGAYSCRAAINVEQLNQLLA